MTRNALSQDDVVRLLTDPSGEARAATAAKIAAEFGKGELAPGATIILTLGLSWTTGAVCDGDINRIN
ncbi:MAG: hypothetical protein FJW24_10680 [Acidimicrobiia bacterium]|nr:hypothetical protein [Acidimicrobiia bacterium]